MRNRLFWLLLLLLCSACAAVPVLPPETPDREEILGRVTARAEAVRGIKALGQVQVSLEGKNLKAQEVFQVSRPAFLRTEILGPFGTPQFFLVLDGPDLRVYNPGENRFYHGRATADHLSAMLPFIPRGLTPEEVVAFLLGGIPIPPGSVSVGRDDREGLWTLDLISDSGRRRLWVEPGSYLVSRAEIHRPGFSAALSFSDFREINGHSFPHRIRFSAAGPRMEIGISYEDLELNPSLSAADFKLPVPRGAEVVPLQ
jgi:outer membrane lipoprotein-sorting protein